mmetsp:Transcript_152623/g.489422  ORF Transcript_152623/g.489422 Transcript_152623/m.489422 type:complete len:205 (-) Transcript_152623:549-1163(-)
MIFLKWILEQAADEPKKRQQSERLPLGQNWAMLLDLFMNFCAVRLCLVVGSARSLRSSAPASISCRCFAVGADKSSSTLASAAAAPRQPPLPEPASGSIDTNVSEALSPRPDAALGYHIPCPELSKPLLCRKRFGKEAFANSGARRMLNNLRVSVSTMSKSSSPPALLSNTSASGHCTTRNSSWIRRTAPIVSVDRKIATSERV